MGFLNSLSASHVTEDTSPLSDFWFSEIGSMSSAGVRVTAEQALKISAVLSGVRFLSQTVAMLPRGMFRRRNGQKEKLPDHPLSERLRNRPNAWMTGHQFFETMTARAILEGKAIARVVGDGELIPQDPTRVTIEQLSTGRLRYVIRNDPGRAPTVLSQDEVVHLAGFGVDGITGIPLVNLFRESAGLALAAEEYGSQFFGNSAMPRIVLRHPGRLEKEGKANIARSWQKAYGGADKSHGTAILDEDMDIKELGSGNNEEHQLIPSRKFQVTEFARWLDVSPHSIGDLERSTFSNVEQQSLENVQYRLMPWIKRWEQVIDRDLITDMDRENGVFFEINVTGLLRGDAESRSKFYSQAVNDGWMSPNDVREKENENPVEGLDVYRFPLNFRDAQEEEPAAEVVEPAPAPAPAPAPVPPARQAAELSTLEERARMVCWAAADRVLGKEKKRLAFIATAEAASMDNWTERVYEFYGRHVDFVCRTLNINVELATDYCLAQCKEAQAGGMSAVESWGDDKRQALLELALGAEVAG